jgi:hypothetical protein
LLRKDIFQYIKSADDRIYVLDITKLKLSLHCYVKVNGTLIIKYTQPFPLFALGNIMMLLMGEPFR